MAKVGHSGVRESIAYLMVYQHWYRKDVGVDAVLSSLCI